MTSNYAEDLIDNSTRLPRLRFMYKLIFNTIHLVIIRGGSRRSYTRQYCIAPTKTRNADAISISNIAIFYQPSLTPPSGEGRTRAARPEEFHNNVAAKLTSFTFVNILTNGGPREFTDCLGMRRGPRSREARANGGRSPERERGRGQTAAGAGARGPGRNTGQRGRAGNTRSRTSKIPDPRRQYCIAPAHTRPSPFNSIPARSTR